ncbi:MAG TPA: HD domain-containing protein [Methyloceanibacter sp.]|jgi:(p)ppGpp synthase/HD superfamily hydrolase
MSTDVMTHALQFATARHAHQRRKYTDLPHVTHLEAVVAILRDDDIHDPTTLAAAHLHDVVEDTQTTIQEIVSIFGESVAELVYWLSDLEKGNRAARALQSC